MKHRQSTDLEWSHWIEVQKKSFQLSYTSGFEAAISEVNAFLEPLLQLPERQAFASPHAVTSFRGPVVVNEDRVDEFFGRANALLGAGRFEEAVEALRAGRDEASAEEDRESEAFFASIAGSFLASRARDVEALEEYARAELCDPSSPAWKTATANQLLNLGQAAKAREKAGEVLAHGHGTPSYEHAGYSLLGLAELALGNQTAAVKAFTASADPARVSSLPASGRDLRLAEGLLSTGAITEFCRSYLREALFRAQADGDEALEGRIHQIESRFTS